MAGAGDVQTLWARSACDGLREAISNLAARERTTARHVGYVTLGDGDVANRSRLNAIRVAASKADALTRIETWRIEKGLEAVIWTDLASNCEDVTAEKVVIYLRSLVEADRSITATSPLRLARTIALARALGRMEAQVAIATVLRRLQHLALATESVEWENSLSRRGLKALPVIFTPSRA